MPRAVLVVSTVLAALMALASLAGLMVDGLYGDNALVRTGWYGNDLVTLVVATPVFVGALAYAPRSLRARLVWLGMTAYIVYNYAFYLFGATFNHLFLVYAALVTGGTYCLIGGLSSLADGRQPPTPAPSRRIHVAAGYTGAVALLLGVFWVVVTLLASVTGGVPAMVTATDTHTNLTGALDLCLVVAPGLLGAWWLWRGHRWGYVLAVVWNVKGAAYLTALTSATLASWRAGANPDVALAALWATIGGGCALAGMALLRDPVVDA